MIERFFYWADMDPRIMARLGVSVFVSVLAGALAVFLLVSLFVGMIEVAGWVR